MHYTEQRGETHTGNLQACCYFCFPQFVLHISLPVPFKRCKLIQSQRPICSSFSFIGLFSPSSNFLPSTPYLTPADWNEVRDDRLHWCCLSAWAIHGNGKVQTGAVGGHGFLLFFLLGAFFLKSLTKTETEKAKCAGISPFPLILKQSSLCLLPAYV